MIWLFYSLYLKSFIAKRVISILVNFRYLRFKLLKYKENNKKICVTFDHNFRYIPLYIISWVSLERHYFVLYDKALTLKMSKMAHNPFCDETLHFLHHRNKSIRIHTHILVRGFNQEYECLVKVTEHIPLFASEKKKKICVFDKLTKIKIN